MADVGGGDDHLIAGPVDRRGDVRQDRVAIEGVGRGGRLTRLTDQGPELGRSSPVRSGDEDRDG